MEIIKKFAVYVGNQKRITYRIIKEDNKYRFQTYINYKEGWVDTFHDKPFDSVEELINKKMKAVLEIYYNK